MCDPYNFENTGTYLSKFTCEDITTTLYVVDGIWINVPYPCGNWDCCEKLWGVCVCWKPNYCETKIEITPDIKIDINDFKFYADIYASKEYTDSRLVLPFLKLTTTDYRGDLRVRMEGKSVYEYNFINAAKITISKDFPDFKMLLDKFGFDENFYGTTFTTMISLYLEFCINTTGDASVMLTIETEVQYTYAGVGYKDKFVNKITLFSYNINYETTIPSIIKPALAYSCLSCSADGKYLVAGSKENNIVNDQSILFWDFAKSEDPVYVNVSSLSNDNSRNFNTVSLGMDGAVIRVYAGAESSQFKQFWSEDLGITWNDAGYNNDNNWIVSSCNLYGTIIWYAKNKENVINYSGNSLTNVYGTSIDINNPLWLVLKLSRYGSHAILCTSSAVYTMYDNSYVFSKINYTFNGEIVDVTITENKTLVVATKSYVYVKNNIIGDWRILSNADWLAMSGYISGCCISDDDKYIAVCSTNGYIVLYKLGSNGYYDAGSNCNVSPSPNVFTRITGNTDLSIMYVISTSQYNIQRTTNRWGHQ